MTPSPAEIGPAAALLLLGVGFYGLVVLRNFIKTIVALQIAAKGVVIALVAAGAASGQINLAQSLAATVIAADTLVAVIGLALAVQIHRTHGTLDLRALTAKRPPPERA